MSKLLDFLHNNRLVWHGTDKRPMTNARASGFEQLDAQLNGGFPPGVVEINSPLGIGELRLLLPTLAQSGDRHKLIFFIAPPAQLNAEMFSHAGIELSRLVIIRPESAMDALWAAEQCLASGCCSAVLLWHGQLAIHQVKRLQLAADKGLATPFIFKTGRHTGASLPVSLSLTLKPHGRGLDVAITKRTGGWSRAPFVLDMQQHWPELTLRPAPDNLIRFPATRVS